MGNERWSLRLLRTAGLITIPASAAGSLGLLFHASHSRPPLLMGLFVIWVLFPFVCLLLAGAASRRWSILTQVALYGTMLVVGLGSLIVYGYDAIRPRREQAAFVYIAVPPASCVFIGSALGVAKFLSGRFHAKDAVR